MYCKKIGVDGTSRITFGPKSEKDYLNKSQNHFRSVNRASVVWRFHILQRHSKLKLPKIIPGRLYVGNLLPELGLTRIEHKLFFFELFGHFRDIPAKSRDIPPKSLVFLGFKGHTKLSGPHPFTWKTPTPLEDYRTKKFRFGFLFLP